jgi:hypothetical protein
MPGAAVLFNVGESALSFSARSSLVPHPAVPTGSSISRLCRLYQRRYPIIPPPMASAASGMPTPRPILSDLLAPPPEPSSVPVWLVPGVGDGTAMVLEWLDDGDGEERPVVEDLVGEVADEGVLSPVLVDFPAVTDVVLAVDDVSRRVGET